MSQPDKQISTDTIFTDQFGRQKRKLRISVTDRCNFNCVYCMPEHPKWINKNELLSFDDLYQFCRFMVHRGIEHIRITGGEPLMRQGVVHFVASLQALRVHGLKRLSMTSNAHYLAQYAVALKQAGLDDINISLDSLDPQQFNHLTKKQLQPVLQGISAAKQAGLNVKINAVLMKGINDDQIVPLAQWSIREKVQLRFIEFMPLDGDRKWSPDHVVSEQQILDTLRQAFVVQEKYQQHNTSEPARQYLVNQHPIGIISTITHPFCATCDRVRLTAQGEFYNCLFATKGLNIKAEIKAINPNVPLSNLMLTSQLTPYIWNKESGFAAIQQQLNNRPARKISMHLIGG